MQLAYTLGEWEDPQAGPALARLALQGADDRFLSAAVLSSVNKKNLESLLASILAGAPNSPPPGSVLICCPPFVGKPSYTGP